MSDEYIDIKELLDVFEQQSCWNCDNERWVRTDRPPWNMCSECFMGQRGTDHDGECVTDEGYADYRLLWYGDVTLEEARRRYQQTLDEAQERLKEMRASDREVRI